MMDSFFQSSNHLYGATKSRIPCPRWTRNSSMRWMKKKAVRCSCLVVAFVFVYECVYVINLSKRVENNEEKARLSASFFVTYFFS